MTSFCVTRFCDLQISDLLFKYCLQFDGRNLTATNRWVTSVMLPLLQHGTIIVLCLQLESTGDRMLGKIVFYFIPYKVYCNRSLAASEPFGMFTQSIKLYTFYCYILKSTYVWTRRFIKQTENERLFLSATFTVKFELVFVLTQKSAFSLRFHFTERKSIGSSRNVY